MRQRRPCAIGLQKSGGIQKIILLFCRLAFGLAPWRPENSEPLHLIVSMFITIRIQNFRFPVLEPFWAAEHTANLWTKLFPSYATFTAAQNRPLPRVGNTEQYDFDAISLQFHLDPN
ncbi:hypothetical protein L3Y34_014871 [Caenorhabditis briggsae]|uniref:Uncharacterized protein n=1 Tax=Caenorhabditis briggsae TaxID=6238 RepID=A0AAE9DS20_CAEBR|nr:hypothetical protein L3Y34_014871 [Caenorhabditis briggsae]